MTVCIDQKADKSGVGWVCVLSVGAPSKKGGTLPPFHLCPQHRIVLSRPFPPALPTGFEILQISEPPSLGCISGMQTVVER